MKKKYLVEIALFLSYVLFAMSWKAGDILIKGHGFGAGQLAIMTNAINFAKIIGSLSAATLILKLGKKKTFLLAILLIVSGGSLPLITDFSKIFIIRFILGLGGAWVLVTINPIIAELYEGKGLVIVNGLNAVAFNVGLAIILTFSKSIISNPEKTIYLISFLVLICGLLWSVVGNSDLKNEKNKIISQYSLKDGFKDKFNWVFAITYSGLLGFYLVSFTFMKPENVKYVIYAGIIGAIVGIQVGNKINNKLFFIKTSAFIQLISAIGFLLMYDYPIAKLIGIILGFTIFLPMPAYVTLAYKRKGVTAEKISVTFSIFWSLSYLVSIIIVQIFAFLVDTTGGNTLPFIFIVVAEGFFFVGNLLFIKESYFDLK